MRPNRDNFQKIALDRIDKLFAQAEDSFKEHPELSRRYVVLARKLSTRYKVKFSSGQKRLFCKSCDAYLKEGINCKNRLIKDRIVRTCLECNAVRRIVHKPKSLKLKPLKKD
jgi:ribonuclease P protein subunit RPR2